MKKNNDTLNTIKKVLMEESEAILAVSNSVSDEYVKLVDVCEKCEGKVIFTGMGKSGHVAKKISATMASLGTPSFFLHPGEAAHGDLGMVSRSDIVIMVSKSGETDELIQIINSLKIIGCYLVGLFCKKYSTLEGLCDMAIVLPLEREACINNLAPTISTTATMAVGDAVAIALSERKMFGKQNFALFHPRGTLGKQLLLTVDGIANKCMEEIAVKQDDGLKKVLWAITKNRLGAVTVVDDEGYLIGLVSDGDIRRAIEVNENILKNQANDIMTNNPISIGESTLAVDAFKMMQEKKISVLPITDADNKLIGMVSFHDIVGLGIGDQL